MSIARCTAADLPDWVKLREMLWPDEAPLYDGAAEMLSTPDMLALLHRDADGLATAFAEASVRRDYVNGCDTSPVVFLEGIYVAPQARGRGTAAALVAEVTRWGRAKGCSELASDALLDNIGSHAFHAAIGFEETERVVYFRRAISE